MKTYTIGEIEAEPTNKPLWALNGSADVIQPADIVIGIPKLNGARSDSLLIPMTWLPICITEQIPRAQLLQSSEFRKAVNSRTIRIISEEQAQALLNQEGAAEERERLEEQETRVKEALRGGAVSSDQVSLIHDGGETPTERRPGAPLTLDELDPGFGIFFESLGGKDDVTTMNAIRTRGKFQRRELQFMLGNLNDKPKSLEFLRKVTGGKV
jgi:hypothetical protein